jgi:hypothetical protein
VNNSAISVIKEVTTDTSSLTILDVSQDNAYIVTSDLLPSGGNQVTVINTASNIQVDYDTLNITDSFVQISPDDTFLYFLSQRDGRTDLYRLEFQTGEVDQVTENQSVGSFYVDQNNILLYQVEQDMYILDLSQTDEPRNGPVQTQISSNFTMWNPFLTL